VILISIGAHAIGARPDKAGSARQTLDQGKGQSEVGAAPLRCAHPDCNKQSQLQPSAVQYLDKPVVQATGQFGRNSPRPGEADINTPQKTPAGFNSISAPLYALMDAFNINCIDRIASAFSTKYMLHLILGKIYTLV